MKHHRGEDTRPMSVGDWMFTIAVLGIPIVNFVMYIAWASSTTGNVNRRNFCKACIIWFCIIFCVSLFITAVRLLAAH